MRPLHAPFLFAIAALAIPGSSFALSPEEVFAKAAPSVVMVFAGDASGGSRTQGSGVIVGKDKVITNCHVISPKNGAPEKKIIVRQAGQVLQAHFVAGNRDYDTCLLAVPGISRHTAVIADSTSLRIGQRVYAIGAPSGLELTLTEGLLSGLRTKGASKVIQTSAAISPGSSGGGLFDDKGNLIGITSFGVGAGTGLNFAYMPDAILQLVIISERSTRDANNDAMPSSAGQAGIPSTPTDARSPNSSLQDRSIPDRWLAEMSLRLKKRIPDGEYRIEFLRAVHYEATRAGLDPQLVLGLIDTVSRFKKYAVSPRGAIGYMQVMPSWNRLIGHADDNLFHLRTNLRYGCTILRHYLDIESGDLFRALSRYEQVMIDGPGSEIEKNPNPHFANNVRANWHTSWAYETTTAR